MTTDELLAMRHEALLGRILRAVDERAYLTPCCEVHPSQREALEAIAQRLHAPTLDVAELRAFVRRLHDEGRLDRVHMLSALGVIAASPRVGDWVEAARLAGEQELAALDHGGPHLDANLASVDRHRGVLAFLRGHYEVALDHFTRALERQRSAENIGNVLASLLRLGELEEAEEILAHARGTLRPEQARRLEHAIEVDPDLAALRSPEVR